MVRRSCSLECSSAADRGLAQRHRPFGRQPDEVRRSTMSVPPLRQSPARCRVDFVRSEREHVLQSRQPIEFIENATGFARRSQAETFVPVVPLAVQLSVAARMTVLFVASSKNLASWAADVGLTKHVYKVGVADGPADAAIAALNNDAFAGEGDWRLLKQQEVPPLDEADAVERLAKREKMVDPNYYPKIRGAVGIFKVKVGNVANHLLVKRALA